MQLDALVAGLPGLFNLPRPRELVTGLESDARRVGKGFVFVAIRGFRADGHDYLDEAVRRGALALVVQRSDKLPDDFEGAVLIVPDTRAALDDLAARFYRHPGREMFCAGITGTNGKTSLTYLIESVLNAGGRRTGVIGTVNHHLGNRVWPSEVTTPDPISLQRRLREFRDAGADAVAMEISSHALDQKRADSVPFDAAVFTNLTRDHLDYHQTFDAYFAAKQRLFAELLRNSVKAPTHAIVNVQDEWGAKLRVSDRAVKWTYGSPTSDFRVKIDRLDFDRSLFTLETPRGRVEVDLPMGGEHNIQNATAAIAVGMAAGFGPDVGARALADFSGVPGRLQRVPNHKGIAVFVDYAHSPDALENVLASLDKVRRTTRSKARIWVVFGCGGDRDKGKRPLMAKAAWRGADRLIITSDNPRTEDPLAIIADIEAGLPPKERDVVQVEPDRGAAIHRAITMAEVGDVVLIAGKGHEDYQIVGTQKIPFSDFNVALGILEGRT